MRHRAPRRLHRPALALACLTVLGSGGIGLASVMDGSEDVAASGIADGGPEGRMSNGVSVWRGASRPPLSSTAASRERATNSPSRAPRDVSPSAATNAPPADGTTSTPGERTDQSGTSGSTPAPDSPDAAASSRGTSSPTATAGTPTATAGTPTGSSGPTPGSTPSGSTSPSGSASPSGNRSSTARETDEAARASDSPAGDAQPPQTYVDVLPGQGIRRVTLGASEEATFQCSIDGGAWTDCSSALTLGSLGAGAHTLAVVATDADGNTDPTPATATWELGLR